MRGSVVCARRPASAPFDASAVHGTGKHAQSSDFFRSGTAPLTSFLPANCRSVHSNDAAAYSIGSSLSISIPLLRRLLRPARSALASAVRGCLSPTSWAMWAFVLRARA